MIWLALLISSAVASLLTSSAHVVGPTVRKSGIVGQRRLDPGKETLKGFFQVRNHKEYQNVVIISFVHLEKINIFCFMHKGVAQKFLPPIVQNASKWTRGGRDMRVKIGFS